MFPLTGYGIYFVLSLRVFDVTAFEKPAIFEAHHSKKFRRYEKTKAISSKGGYMNFLVLCIKPYQILTKGQKGISWLFCEGQPSKSDE